MPSLSTTPRSAGTSTRGNLSTTPRSAGSTTSAANLARASAAVGAQLRDQKARDRPGSSTPARTPLRAVLDFASTPAYMVGNYARGRPDQAFLNLATLGQGGDKTFLSSTPVAKAALRRVPGPEWLRGGLGLGLDIFTDPTTYVTFGAGGAARGASGAARIAAERAAAEKLAAATERAQASGRRLPSAREVAEIAVEAAEARRSAPRTFKVNVRTPFTRNKTRLIAESRTIARAAEAVGSPVRNSTVGTALRRVFRADQGVDPALYEGRRAVRYWAEATQRLIRQAIDEQRKYARKLKVDSERVTRHLDQPSVYPARTPEEADVFARAAGLRDEIEQIARDAGVEMGLVENYVMHLPKSPKDAKAFERMFGAKPENAAYTRNRALQNLDQWEVAGITPELDVWRLFDVRAGQGIRDAAIKGYMDMAAARGVKPLPLREPDVAGQAAKVAESQGALDTLVAKTDTAAAKEEVRSARKRLKGARLTLQVAERSEDPAAIARAQRAVREAEDALDNTSTIIGAPTRAAQATDAVASGRYSLRDLNRRVASGPNPPATVGDVLSSSLDEVSDLSRSRGARAARLPEPTAGRYALPLDPEKVPVRLRARARYLVRRSEEVRATVAEELRQRARAIRSTYNDAGHDTRSKGASPLAHLDKGSYEKTQFGDGTGYMAWNGGNENSVHYKRVERAYKSKKTGKARKPKIVSIRKSLQDYEDDVLREIDEQVERGGVESLLPPDRALYEAIEESRALQAEAEKISASLRNAEGGAFGELDDAAGKAAVEQLAEDLPAQRVNMRSRRERGAARHGSQETPRIARNATADGPTKGTTKAARARFRRYFNGQGPLSEAIAAVKLGAEQEVKAAQSAAQRQVTKARAGLERAMRSKDEEAIRFARRLLSDAQRTERSVSAELARARVTYGGTPRQVAARVRQLVREQRLLVVMEKRARRVAEHNAQLAARPGREVADYEEYAAHVADGWQAHTSKYHKGTLLDPVTHEAVRKVDAEVSRLLVRQDEVAAVTRFFNQMGGAWKSLQLLTTRYHIRNFFDDAFADWLAGSRNPYSYLQASKILRGSLEGSIKTKAGTFTAEQIVQMAEVQGVMHMGFAAWEVGKQQERGLRMAIRGHGVDVRAPGSGHLARGSRWVGEVREDWTRLGLFIEMLKKGEDPVQAGLTVRRYRYDYSDLAPFLMQARAVALPFLTFTWKTIPMLGKQLAERPGTFSRINMVQEYLQETGGDPDRSLLAPWEADAFGVPAPEGVKAAFGADPGEPVLYNPRITFRYADLEMWNPRPDAITRNWLGLVGPIKLPVEALTNYSTFQARQLRPGERVKAPALIEWMHDRGIPIAGYGPKKDAYTGEEVPGYSARLHNVLSGFPPFSQAASVVPGGGNQGADAQKRVAQFLTGINLRPADEAKATFYAERYGGR